MLVLEEGGGPPADLWPFYKELLATVEAAVLHRQPGIRPRLEQYLKAGRSTFEKLLQNPLPSASDADLIRKATSEGILLPGSESPTLLPASLVEEAFIVSDLFKLNQVSAVHLLLHGEEQLPQYPGLTRGLVAVVLYYDGRKAVVQALRTLIASRPGLCWSTEVTEDIAGIVSTFTTELMEGGLTDAVLAQLAQLDWTAELAGLQRAAALGDSQHVSTLRLLHVDLRQSLADCLYCYAAQAGLPTSATLKLLEYLAGVGPNTASGGLDSVTVALLMAALQALDVSGADKEDAEMPLISDGNFIVDISRELEGRSRKWACPRLLALLQFAWAVTLSSLRVTGALTTETTPQLDDDELFMDLALEGGVFHSLLDLLLPAVSSEEFYLRRLHTLLTDFLALMPLRIKELRNRADEAARNKLMHEQEGIQYTVPSAGQHFGQLLLVVAALYAGDPLDLGLATAYWCSSDQAIVGPAAMMAESLGRAAIGKQVALYKFVRLAGDLLMPSLFIPYVKMLAGLADTPAAAPLCFSLLKQNSSAAAGGGNSSNVSLDHFFHSLSQYHQNLRQENNSSSGTAAATALGLDHPIYRTKPLTRGISPQEVEGLSAVLDLITVLARRSDLARLSLAEHPHWALVPTVLGLLACSVPCPIKARLVQLLAALAISPDLVHPMWLAIEQAQLLGISGGVGGRPGGIAGELEEVETRAEEFPLTRAFIQLLDRLTDVEIPSALGSGIRTPPGILPYLSFVQDAVFLRFSTRTYKNPAEKWEVAADCLAFFRKLLQEYEPSPADFTNQGAGCGLHPGFYLLLHLHQTSLLLRMVLFVLDEARTLLDTYSPFPGKKNLEAAATAALELLEAGLRLSEDFITAGRTAGASVVLTSLAKLLLGLNPRTGRPDHMLNIVKYVYYGYWMPTAKLAAVKVIGYVASSPANQPALLATLTSSTEVSHLTLKAFTEALDTEDDEEEEGDSAEAAVVGSRGPWLTGRKSGAARLAILDMLRSGLSMASPSLAHFLLGFDLRRGVGRSELQSPAVAGIRTPLHAVVGLLTPVDPGVPAAIINRAPQLASAMFQLVFMLVSNPETAEPVLRFLRSGGGDFFASQLACITAVLEKEGVHSQRAAAWLLRATAVELRILAKSRQASQVGKLLGLLLDAAPGGSSDHLDGGSDSGEGTTAATNASGLYSNTTFSQLSRTTAHSRYQSSSKLDSPLANHRLITILNSISFRVEQLPPANWELFDDSQVTAVLEQCEEESCDRQRLIAVPRLHRILAAELSALQGSTGINQRALVQSEIQAILEHAVRWNAIQEGAAARRDLLDAWRQVTEVLLVTADQSLSAASRQQILLQLLQTLLNKVIGGQEETTTATSLALLVSSAVLLLMTALRQTYDSVPDRSAVLGETFVGILDSEVGHLQQSYQGTFSAALHTILKGLVGWIMSVGAGSQVIRTNVYSALLAFLRIGKSATVRAPVGASASAVPASHLELSEVGKLQKTNLEIILGQGGPAFMEILARDASSGHEIRRMLALAVLDELVMLDHRAGAPCTRHLTDQGFVKHLVESLLLDEAGLVNLVTQQAGANIRDLYVFEAKLGLLSRIAARPHGAEILLQAGLMARLAEFSVLDLRPDSDVALLMLQKQQLDGGDGIESTLSRYHSILFPVLRLCQAVLASLGGENRSAAAQMLHFITGHEEVFALVLRASTARASLAPSLLQELALVTGVVARAATADVRVEVLDAAGFELSGQLARIQRQMLSLLQLFQLNEGLVSSLDEEEEANAVTANQYPPRSLLVMQVVANVASYVQGVVSAGSASSRSCRLVVSPALLEVAEGQTTGRPASLGLLVMATKNLTAQLARVQGRLEALEEKAVSLSSLPTPELLSLAGLPSTEKLPSLTVRRLAGAQLGRLTACRREELLLAATAIESLTFIIWRHLEHFLLYSSAALAATPATPYQATVRRLNEGRSEMGDTATASPRSAFAKVDLDKLKGEVRVVLNDSFFQRLTDIVEIVERTTNSRISSAGFLQAIIRRSKRLALLHTQ